MKVFRCSAFVLTFAALGPAAGALAQKFPEKAVRIVVPFAAGGGTDIAARYGRRIDTESYQYDS